MTNSDKQFLISAARRRAKAAARADGAPHQSHLERIAREAGRDDWGAFLSDPVELPEEEMAIDTEEEDPNAKFWRDVAKTRLRHVFKMQAPAAFVVLALLFVAWDKTMLIQLTEIIPRIPNVILKFISQVIFGLMIGPPLLMTMITVLTIYHGRNKNPQKGAYTHLWKKCLIYSISPALTIYALNILPDVASSVQDSDFYAIYDMQDDQVFLHPIKILGEKDPKPVVVLSQSGNIRRVAYVIDGRATPRYVRRWGVNMETNKMPEPLRSKAVDYPVVRITAQLNCSTGSHYATGIEVASSVSSSAVARKERDKPRKLYTLDTVDRDTLCNADIAALPSKEEKPDLYRP